MKQIKILISLLLVNIFSYAQNDKSTKILEVYFSNPQPRINERAEISIDLSQLTDTLINSIPLSYRKNIGPIYMDRLTIASIKTDKLGKFEIGSMEYRINDTKYKSGKLTYEVIDSLPNIDKGIWIRKYKENDSTFWIIIDQRKPIEENYVRYDSSGKVSKEFLQNLNVQFRPEIYDRSVQYSGSPMYGSTDSLIINGVLKVSYHSLSTYRLKLLTKKEIKITRRDFIGLPDGYVFRDIIINSAAID